MPPFCALVHPKQPTYHQPPNPPRHEMRKQYGLTAQGEPLPKFQDVGLSDSVRNGTMRAAATLDKWRHGWRIRHPQAVTHVGKSVSLSPISGTLPGIYPVLGAWVGSQRKRPHCACLREHCLAATRSALRQLHVGITQMLFTFLIQRSRACRVADLPHIRTITAVADTEAQARIALAGLPLVFLSRTPTGRAAA